MKILKELFRKEFRSKFEGISCKNWLRGVHSYCEKEYINQYIQEYFYRLNRLNFRTTILENLLRRMCKERPMTYESIKCFAT